MLCYHTDVTREVASCQIHVTEDTETQTCTSRMVAHQSSRPRGRAGSWLSPFCDPGLLKLRLHLRSRRFTRPVTVTQNTSYMTL